MIDLVVFAYPSVRLRPFEGFAVIAEIFVAIPLSDEHTQVNQKWPLIAPNSGFS